MIVAFVVLFFFPAYSAALMFGLVWWNASVRKDAKNVRD